MIKYYYFLFIYIIQLRDFLKTVGLYFKKIIKTKKIFLFLKSLKKVSFFLLETYSRYFILCGLFKMRISIKFFDSNKISSFLIRYFIF